MQRSHYAKARTCRATGLIAHSRAYVQDQLMHPIFKAIFSHFLTTRNSVVTGDSGDLLEMKPHLSSTTAFRIEPGARAQVLHRVSPSFLPCLGVE